MLSLLIRILVTVFVVLPAKLLGFALSLLGPVIKAVVWVLLLPLKLLLLPFKLLF